MASGGHLLFDLGPSMFNDPGPTVEAPQSERAMAT
jgi:hypothetical protein